MPSRLLFSVIFITGGLSWGLKYNNRTVLTEAEEIWISLGYVVWYPCKVNAPFGEFLTYLIYSLIPGKSIVSWGFEKLPATVFMLLNIQALVQLLFQRPSQSRSQNLNPTNSHKEKMNWQPEIQG